MKKQIKDLINEADNAAQALRIDLGLDHPDVQYMLGIRDGYLKIYNLINENY